MWAGNPSLRRLRTLGGTATTPAGVRVDALPTSTVSHLLNGRSLPRLPRLEFVRAYVTACLVAGEHPADQVERELARWVEQWRRLAAADDGVETAAGANPAAVAAPAAGAKPAGPADPADPADPGGPAGPAGPAGSAALPPADPREPASPPRRPGPGRRRRLLVGLAGLVAAGLVTGVVAIVWPERGGAPARPDPTDPPAASPRRPEAADRNPYTPEYACDNSSNKTTGYRLYRSREFPGGVLFQLYSSTAHAYCAAVMKTESVGEKSEVWSTIERWDGIRWIPGMARRQKVNYYTGTFMRAGGRCMRVTGGTPMGSTWITWGDCAGAPTF